MSKSLNFANNITYVILGLKWAWSIACKGENKGKDDVSYIPGAFSSKVIPDSEVNTPVIVSDNVIFVSDDDVKAFIVLKGFS